ncbi:MAG: M28 family peptidase [Spirochaetales bacterium]|nr:M28 family peptidase [Spirochaetales bacterium]
MIAASILFVGGASVYFSLAVFIFGIIYVFLQGTAFMEVFDFLFPKATGWNVYGVVEPKEEVKQQVIVAGHHDAAYVFRWLLRWQKLYGIRIFLNMTTYFLATLVVLFWCVYRLVAETDPAVSSWLPIIIAAGSVIPLQSFFSVDYHHVSPGAGDNLIASEIAIHMADFFRENRLKHTRIIALSTDAEEPGLRGAKRFVKRHYGELHEIPTTVINMECLYSLRDLGFIVKDLNGLKRLSNDVAETCSGLAASAGYPHRIIKLPFGGGATDAAEFGHAGIPTTTIFGMSTAIIRDQLVYHTPWDTVDKIEPSIVEATVDILHRYLVKKDAGTITALLPGIGQPGRLEK